jgi:glycosyltransferase involved in cell wall biosynthesis
VRPLSVLDLRDTDEIGGPGKTILETFRALDAARFRMHVGVFLRNDERADTPFVAAARDYGMPVHEVRGVHQYDPRLVYRTARLIKRLDIDIVHAHEVKSDVITYLSSLVHRVPIVTTMHGWIGNSARQRALIRIDKRVARRFDCVIAVSSLIREQLVEAGVPAKNVRLVHNAIVLERYRRNGAGDFLEGLLKRRPSHPVIASIGRLSAEKGHADLVEALRIVAARGGQVSAVLAGDGPERAKLQRQIAAAGLSESVHLPGYVDQPQRILDEADLMVLPSHTEGLPNAALEALAMGVPVLATRVGGTPDVITDGETGRLVPAHDPESLAVEMLKFLVEREAWSAMAVRGQAMVKQRFDFPFRTRAIEAIYAELGARR